MRSVIRKLLIDVKSTSVEERENAILTLSLAMEFATRPIRGPGMDKLYHETLPRALITAPLTRREEEVIVDWLIRIVITQADRLSAITALANAPPDLVLAIFVKLLVDPEIFISLTNTQVAQAMLGLSNCMRQDLMKPMSSVIRNATSTPLLKENLEKLVTSDDLHLRLRAQTLIQEIQRAQMS
jgi:hypothetical protein